MGKCYVLRIILNSKESLVLGLKNERKNVGKMAMRIYRCQRALYYQHHIYIEYITRESGKVRYAVKLTIRGKELVEFTNSRRVKKSFNHILIINKDFVWD